MTGEERDRLEHEMALARFDGKMPEGRTPSQRAKSVRASVPCLSVEYCGTNHKSAQIGARCGWKTLVATKDPTVSFLYKEGHVPESQIAQREVAKVAHYKKSDIVGGRTLQQLARLKD
jgi:hypothetical protein